ncbi:GvpL/GvpF family gas vesicle protein [Streptomyces diastatochromogenes]|uniref:Gas vesicle protein n=1 Tax=Streptomyces diastatochromogenes TaxID=42236 RepID=A0A233RRI6_STRDA|nr:GvpL/GvpF family gas vesicle protein [Streptomyces diastatochromogenes]MCZ0984666.1 GvpL/GvpF family gas vesicle protein [Streptomyces diastatochromogenes]OXY86023.1 gas vesicle protein [Streptomyces diastatochromogenes]
MAVYVYSITSKDLPMRLDDLHGVGDPPSPLRTVTAGVLCAVVSDAPEDLRPRRRDVLAHQQVQERLMADGAVLPLRFGMTAENDEVVRAALEDSADTYQEQLRNLNGATEYNLKVSWEEEALLRRILLESEDARKLNAATREGGTPGMSLALGELVAQEAEVRQQALAAGIVEALRPYVRDESLTSPGGHDFLNISFLVQQDKEEMFLATEISLANQLGEECEFRLSGPLPPYSFV